MTQGALAVPGAAALRPGRRRRARRHLLLGMASALLVGFVAANVPSPRVEVRLSLAFAYVSLGLLAATLLVGPGYVLRGQRSPAHSDLRRDLGIWGGCLALIHVVFGFQVHMGGQMLYYFVYPPGKPHSLLRDVGLSANYLGAAATLVILLLLAISNHRALRRLGTERWKRLQRWNYAAFALVAVHGAIYLVMERRVAPVALVFGAVVLGVTAAQSAGFRRRRLDRAAPAAGSS